MILFHARSLAGIGIYIIPAGMTSCVDTYASREKGQVLV